MGRGAVSPRQDPFQRSAEVGRLLGGAWAKASLPQGPHMSDQGVGGLGRIQGSLNSIVVESWCPGLSQGGGGTGGQAAPPDSLRGLGPAAFRAPTGPRGSQRSRSALLSSEVACYYHYFLISLKM